MASKNANTEKLTQEIHQLKQEIEELKEIVRRANQGSRGYVFNRWDPNMRFKVIKDLE